MPYIYVHVTGGASVTINGARYSSSTTFNTNRLTLSSYSGSGTGKIAWAYSGTSSGGVSVVHAWVSDSTIYKTIPSVGESATDPDDGYLMLNFPNAGTYHAVVFPSGGPYPIFFFKESSCNNYKVGTSSNSWDIINTYGPNEIMYASRGSSKDLHVFDVRANSGNQYVMKYDSGGGYPSVQDYPAALSKGYSTSYSTSSSGDTTGNQYITINRPRWISVLCNNAAVQNVTVTLSLGAGVSSFTATDGSTSKTANSSTTSVSFTVQEGRTITISSITYATGYHAGSFVEGTQISADSTKTVNVLAVANTFKFAYYNDGSKVGESSHTYGTSSSLKTASALGMSKSGYTFYGWSTANSNLTRSYTDGQSVTTAVTTDGATVNLYAIWSRSVTFRSGISNATSKTSTEYYNNGTKSTAIPSAPTSISGWTALGWRADTTATTRSQGTTGTITTASSANWYAVYSRTVTLSYTNGGGTGTAPASVSDTQYYNSNGSVSSCSFVLATNPFTRTGYAFSKWDLGNAGSSVSLSPAVSASANVSTAAVWTANTYTVAYYINGTKKTTSSHTYGTAKALTDISSIGSYSGYDFYGWATSDKNLTRTYTNKQSVSNLTSTNGGTVNLYAIWSRSVTFYSGKNKATTKTSTEYYNNGTRSTAIPASPTAITSWTVRGWRADTFASTSNIQSSTGTITSTGSSLWYAVYDRTITLSYNNNGGSGTTDNQTTTQVYNSADSITEPSFTLKAANTFTRTGYTFSKWGTTSSGGTQYKAGAVYKPSAPITSTTVAFTVYAIWSAIVYTIYFDANGGSTTPSSISAAFDSTITLPSAISKSSETSNGYKVTFNMNSHGGTAPSAVYATNTTTYSFNGWAKNSTSGTSYSAGSSYKIADANDITFYATWTSTLSRGSITLPTNISDDPPYLFKGWGTSSTSTSPLSNPYTPTKSITLYAIWVGDYVNATFNGNGGTFKPGSGTTNVITKFRNESIVLPSNGSSSSGWYKNDCKLIGWSSGNTKYPVGATVVLTDNMTFTAIWYQNFYWTDSATSDALDIVRGKPTTNATAMKWYAQTLSLQKNIQTYVDSSFVPSAASSGWTMIATEFKRASDALNMGLAMSEGEVILAQDFISIRNELNAQAHLII